MLGTYSIDENGDTTLTDYGIYTIEDGELTFDKTVKARPSQLTACLGERACPRARSPPARIATSTMEAASLPAARRAPRAIRGRSSTATG